MNDGIAVRIDSTCCDQPEPATAGAEALDFANLYQVYRLTLELEERRVLGLVEVERNSYGEVSRRLDLKEADVRALVFHARRKVYRGMARALDDLRSPNVGS